jgi:hypothetical protein
MFFAASVLALCCSLCCAESIYITSPRFGKVISTGQAITITWTSTSITYVTIKLYRDVFGFDPVLETITSSTASDGSFHWTPSSSLLTGDNYYMKICNTASSGLFTSTTCSEGSDFTISGIEPEAIYLTSPRFGKVISTGQAITITWTSTSITYVTIKLYRDVF